MSNRLLWVGCVLAGLATFAMTAIIFPMFPVDMVPNSPDYPAPIYAFEFAHSEADLIRVFGDVDDPGRARRLDMMDRGNRWDFLYMTLYSMFGALFGWAAIRDGYRWGWLVLAAAVVSGIADAVETRLLLEISSLFRVQAEQGSALANLLVPVSIKFTAIGLTLVGAGLVMRSTPKTQWPRPWIIPIVFGAITVLAAFELFGALSSVGTFIGLSWLLMLLFAGLRVWRGPIQPRP